MKKVLMKKVLMKKVLMKKVLCKSSTGKMLKYKIYVSIHSKVRLDQVRLSSPCNNSFLSVFNLLHKTFYNFFMKMSILKYTFHTIYDD